MPVLGYFSPYDIKVQVTQAVSNRPDVAVAYEAMIDAGDGRNLYPCATEEGFVASVQLGAVNGSFPDRN
ncbi:MAG: hypothetical protein FJ026_18200, partial [Chloroflexi bacterium]|nr:hypothetical protein [Chloroflexota bacterium]